MLPRQPWRSRREPNGAIHHERRESTDAKCPPVSIEMVFVSQLAVWTPSLVWSHVQAPLPTTARGCPLGCRVAREPRTRGLPGTSPLRHGGPPDQPLRAPAREPSRGLPVRGLRGRAVPRRRPVRLRDWVAQLHLLGDPGRRRRPHRLQDAGATARGHMHPLRGAPGTRVRRRSGAHGPAMVHQRGRPHTRWVCVSTRGGAARLDARRRSGRAALPGLEERGDKEGPLHGRLDIPALVALPDAEPASCCRDRADLQ